MRVGETVRTAIPLPGIPAGVVGVVREVGRVFVLVSFADGRQGYYSRPQLISASTCPLADGEDARATTPLGISGLRVPRGSHCCLLPASEHAAVDATARFAAAGLKAGEAVICAVPHRWQPQLLLRLRELECQTNGLCDQRLILITPARLYLPASQFSGRRQASRTASIVASALKGNPGGARCFAHVGERPGSTEWWEYETLITPILGDAGATALCVYDRTGWGTDSWHRAIELHHYVARDYQVSAGGLIPL